MGFGKITERLLPERAVRRSAVVLALVFAAAFATGWYYAPAAGLKDLADVFSTMADQFREIPGGSIFLLILMNNVFASLLLLYSGLLAGVIPALSVVLNGFVLGLVYRQFSGTMGHGRALLDLVPHAIFEIPALLVSASYGVWLGMAIIRRLRKKETAPIGDMVNHAFKRYFTVVFPLLIVAAAVETALILRGP